MGSERRPCTCGHHHGSVNVELHCVRATIRKLEARLEMYRSEVLFRPDLAPSSQPAQGEQPASQDPPAGSRGGRGR